MTEWIHCNNCFHIPNNTRRFLLTDCGHIFCTQCLPTEINVMCKMCRKSCSTIALTSQMKPDVQLFFTDPVMLANKHMQELKQVINFQNGHRVRLFQHMTEKLSNCQQICDEYSNVTNHIKDLESVTQRLEESNRALLEENAYLKKLVTQTRASPATCINSAGPYSLINNLNLNTPDSSQTPPQIPKDTTNQTPSIKKNLGSTHITPGRLTMKTPLSTGRLGRVQSATVSVHGLRNPYETSPINESPSGFKRPGSVKKTPVNLAKIPQYSTSTAPAATYSQYEHLLLGKSRQSRSHFRTSQNLITITNLRSLNDMYKRAD